MTHVNSIRACIRACPEHRHLTGDELDAYTLTVADEIKTREARPLRTLPNTVWPNGRAPR